MVNINRLEALPPELLAIIVDFIPRPTDLKNLCLTSQKLRIHATERLYHKVVVDKSCLDWELGRGLLSATNPGVNHVRQLIVVAAKTYSSEKERTFLKHLLQLLPRHTLTKVNFKSVALDRETMFTLCVNQNAITTLLLGPLTFDFAADLSNSIYGVSFWSNLRLIGIPCSLGSVNDLAAYRQLITRNPKLIRLNIRCSGHTLETDELIRPADMTDNGTLVNELFPPVDDGDDSTGLDLGAMSLVHQDLQYSARTLSLCINFDNIRRLSLEYCSNTSSFLAALAVRYAETKHVLRYLTIIDEGDTLDSDSLLQFLRSVRRLKSCRISAGMLSGDFDLAALEGHRKTLEVLLLALGENNEPLDGMDLPSQLYTHLSNGFPRLRCVGVPMPRLTLSDRVEETAGWHTYQEALLALLRLEDLRVLRLLSFPHVPVGFFIGEAEDYTDDPDDDYSEMIEEKNVELYKHNLTAFVHGSLAKTCNKATGRQQMPIIFFKGNGVNMYEDEFTWYKGRPMYYLPTKQIDMLGNVSHSFQLSTRIDAKYLDD